MLQAQTPPQPAPPKPAAQAQSGYENIESVWSISLFYWRPDGQPLMRGGKESTNPPAQALDLPGKPKGTPGVILTFPTGRSNRLEVSAFETRGSGNTVAGRELTFFGETFDQGDLLTADYRVRNAKVSWNYLSYPYPPLDAKFRIKTLWEVQYTSIRSVITAPLSENMTQAKGSRSIIYPTLGLGMELVPSPKHFRVEIKGSGMGFPHRAALWDAEGSAVVRIGNLEIFGGGKAFHFKTSPQKDQYMLGTLWGPYGGIRWVFR
jgi:hypothetical protein